MKNLSRLSLFAASVFAFVLPVSLAAATISGTVLDKTTGKPAAGDTAVLLDLQQGMTESAHTTIDAKGHYSFDVPSTAGMHLVRVDHQKASYYGPVPPNTTTVNIDVFDVAPKVDGIHVYADVERMETNQQGLSITDSYFVRNESKPPKTQLSARSFEIYLPKDAVLEGATAAGPGGMAVASSPVPTGEKGHYAFIFPLRPGETRFQVGYHLPYNGSATLHPQVSMPADNLAIMLPKSMTFSGQGFQQLQGDASGPGSQTFLAAGVKPGAPVAFTVSGTGSMPREQQQAQNGSAQGGPGQGMGAPDQSGPDQSAPPPNAPGGGLGNPIDTPDPLQKYKWWILSGVGLALVIAAAFMLRAKPGQQPAVAGAAPPPNPLTPTLPAGVKATAVRAGVIAAPAVSAPNGAYLKPVAVSGTLAALKEELFALETERLEGKITDAEYAEHKAALEVLLKRALARESAAKSG
ncbi:MAG TPA: carboxypeptidase regulatory-like domain-containing protein [Acidobacteriaceae bacterium]